MYDELRYPCKLLSVGPTLETATMSQKDDAEAERLIQMLQALDTGLPVASPTHEALQKAALALRLCFMQGIREQVEGMYGSINAPLTDAQKAHLQSLGIKPVEDE
jgi:hypothetical protein